MTISTLRRLTLLVVAALALPTFAVDVSIIAPSTGKHATLTDMGGGHMGLDVNAAVSVGSVTTNTTATATAASPSYTEGNTSAALSVDLSGNLRTKVLSLPALPAGTNVIGHVIADSGSTTAVTALPALPSGTNVIGHVIADTGSTTAVTALPALPAGTNVIGHVITDSGTVTLGAGTNVIGHAIVDSGTVKATAGKTAAAPAASVISVATTATALPASALANRTSLCVYNNGSATIYLGPSGVSTSTGYPVLAGGQWCDDVGSQTYYAITASGTVETRVLEN